MNSSESKQIFEGPSPSLSAMIFFMTTTSFTAWVLSTILESPQPVAYLPLLIFFPFFMLLGMLALIGIPHRLVYELQDSALVIHQTLQTEVIPYDRIEEVQLDDMLRRGFTAHLSSGIRSWTASTRQLSMLTVVGIRASVIFGGKQVSCVSIKLRDSKTCLVIFPDDKELDFYNALLKRLNRGK